MLYRGSAESHSNVYSDIFMFYLNSTMLKHGACKLCVLFLNIFMLNFVVYYGKYLARYL